MKEQNGSSRASVFGIDIGKNVFHVVGVDVGGQPVQKARFEGRACFSSSSALRRP